MPLHDAHPLRSRCDLEDIQSPRGIIPRAGAGGLGTAIAYAIRPTERKLALIRPLSLAGILAALCSFAVGISTALKGPADAGINPESLNVMLAGLSEAFIPPFVAFAFLAVAWLLVAAGLRRHA